MNPKKKIAHTLAACDVDTVRWALLFACQHLPKNSQEDIDNLLRIREELRYDNKP